MRADGDRQAHDLAGAGLFGQFHRDLERAEGAGDDVLAFAVGGGEADIAFLRRAFGADLGDLALRAGRGSRPCRPGFSVPASPISTPRSLTSASPSSKVSEPAATAAVNSPMEWPAKSVGSTVLPMPAQRSWRAASQAIDVTKVAGCWLTVVSSSSAGTFAAELREVAVEHFVGSSEDVAGGLARPGASRWPMPTCCDPWPGKMSASRVQGFTSWSIAEPAALQRAPGERPSGSDGSRVAGEGRRFRWGERFALGRHALMYAVRATSSSAARFSTTDKS